MQKVVFNPHYLTYFDVAVSQYWRELALPYEHTLNTLNGDLFVKKASLEYNGSAVFDESLAVCLRCERTGRSSMTFKGAIFRDSEALILGEIVYVFVDQMSKTSKPIPDALKELISRYEKAQETVNLRVGEWSELKEDAIKIRHDVFVKEQGVPLEIEIDELDQTGIHAVLYNGFKIPIATARLVRSSHSPQTNASKIGRMAVRKDLRGSHWGSKVLKSLEGVAIARGDRFLSLSAQIQAKDFYTKHGFTQKGSVYEEAGISHVEMIKNI